MAERDAMMDRLGKVFKRWEQLLATLTEDQISTANLPGDWSIKDVIAHLWAWQQLSIARLVAALQDREPDFYLWPAELEPESEDDLDQINAWIYETYRGESWPVVHRAWREGFLQFLELSRSVPDQDLTDADRYPWLRGYSLFAVLEGSYEHHQQDHLEPLLAASL
jgi:hypothetical protein